LSVRETPKIKFVAQEVASPFLARGKYPLIGCSLGPRINASF